MLPAPIATAVVQVITNDVASPTEHREAYKEIIKCQLKDESEY